MKKNYLLVICCLITATLANAKTWIINNTGNTFSPSTITIQQGDTVEFVLGLTHNVLEVSQATFDANGTTAKETGFATPSKGGKVFPAQLTVGTHYYVCTPHASQGMKGQIIVQNPNSIDEDLEKSEIVISPNPTANLLTIKGLEKVVNADVNITNANGVSVLTLKNFNSENATIDISSLSAGVYWLTIADVKKNTYKFVKK